MNDSGALYHWSAQDLAAAVREREISPVEIIDAIEARVETTEPVLNAFITLDFERAREAAAAAEREVASGRPLGPLHGVPFSVKDLLDTEGLRTTFGSFAFEHNVPGRSVAAVRRLAEAGAVLFGKTTTPEFGHKPLTEAPLFGRTSNPWDPGCTPGGSSGGAAAAVAAGCGPIAVGTDGGGSTRIPAAACGVVGVKQTLGVVPHDQTPDVFGLLAYIGPIARTVSDAGLALEVMAGPDSGDPHSIGREVSGVAAAALHGLSVRGLRIGYLPLLGNSRIDPETRALVDDAVAVLEREGANVEVIDETLPPTYHIWGPLTFSIWAQRFAKHEQVLGDRMSDSLRRWMAEGRAASALDVQAAMEGRTTLYRHVEQWLARFDFLVTPTLSRPAVSIEHDPSGEVEVAGELCGGLREGWYPYTHPFNLTGHPAVTVPAGWTTAGLPVGMQLVGRYLTDGEVLGVARTYELARPWQSHYRVLDAIGSPTGETS